MHSIGFVPGQRFVLCERRLVLTPTLGTTESSGSYYCRLELDINTAPECFGLLTPDKLPELFTEMVEMGKEIAEEGDINQSVDCSPRRTSSDRAR